MLSKLNHIIKRSYKISKRHIIWGIGGRSIKAGILLDSQIYTHFGLQAYAKVVFLGERYSRVLENSVYSFRNILGNLETSPNTVVRLYKVT